MKVEINPRGNGACPLCKTSGNCRVQDTLNNAMKDYSDENNPFEMVIYSCPRFQEITEIE